MVFSDFESIDTPQWYLSICIIDTLLPGPIDIDDYVLFMAFGPMPWNSLLSKSIYGALSISIRLVYRSILIVSSIQNAQHSETSTIDRVLSIDANASHRRTSGQESLIPWYRLVKTNYKSAIDKRSS